MGQTFAVGLDVGGTDVKAALVDDEGTIAFKTSRPTEPARGADAVLADMADLSQTVVAEVGVSKSSVVGVGIGAPGPLSPRRGIILKAANLPRFKNVPIRDEVSRLVGLPAVLANDGNAAAYGEFWVGAGRDVADMVMLTLGTGVGAGVIVEGRLLSGHFENAAELGHTVVQPGGLLCSCGQRGCLEQYASATNVARRVIDAIEAGAESSLSNTPGGVSAITSKHLVDAVSQGDPLAKQIWEDACRYLAIACLNAERSFNPAMIVLGGGMSAAGALLLDSVRRNRDQHRWSLMDDIAEIVLAQVGNDAGVIGAAGLMFADLRGD